MILYSFFAAADAAPASISTQTVVLVLFALGIGYALMAINRLQQRLNELVPAPVATVTPPASPAAGADRSAGALSPQVVAVIAAAVQVTLGSAHFRVVSLAGARVPAESGAVWSAEGRREIFQSHKVR